MNTETISTHVIPDDLLAIQTPRVLILEDDADLALIIEQLLRTKGCEVTHCRNGTEGLKALLKREFHVILCDMVMPGFPGDMFYTAVKQSRPHLCERFIFMTGHRADRRIDQFIRIVRGLMLWKPFAAHELLCAIQQVLHKVEAQDAELLCTPDTVPRGHFRSMPDRQPQSESAGAVVLDSLSKHFGQEGHHRERSVRQNRNLQAVILNLAPGV